MDKLGTYALVAALKEISDRKTEKKKEGIVQNERWISLRSIAHELPQATLEPPTPAPEPEILAIRGPAPAQPAMPPASPRLNRNRIAEQRLALSLQATPVPEAAAPVARPLSTTPERHTFSAIRQINMRHESVRKSNGGK